MKAASFISVPAHSTIPDYTQIISPLRMCPPLTMQDRL